MKKTLQRTLLCVIALCLAAALLTGCKKTPVEEAETPVPGAYVWNYDRAFADEHDADMVIDGVLDEERWQNQHYLTFTDAGVTMQYTTVFTEYGVYIGAKAEGDRIRWKGRFNFSGFWQDTSLNSAFGFKIQGKDVTEEHATTVFNFFIDAKNAASRNQTRFEAKATTDGDVDKGTANAMTAELFVSWKALNVKIPKGKSYPDYIRIFPAYRHVVSTSVSPNNKWLYPLFAEYGESRLLCRSRFNDGGYVNYEREGALLGNAGNGISMSDGWNLSKLVTETGKSLVTSDTYHNQAIFFKGIKANNYMYETTVKFSDESWGLYGHAGVCDMIDAERFNAFYIVGSSVKAGTTRLEYCTVNFHGENGAAWNQKDEGTFTVPSGKNPYRDGVKITVIKKGGTLYYFIYDTLVLTKTIDWLSGKSCPGLYTMSRMATFSGYSVTDYTGKNSQLEALIRSKTT